MSFFSNIFSPVQCIKEMFFRNVEVEVCVSWGSEGVITAALPTEEMSKSFVGEEFRGVEDCVL